MSEQQTKRKTLVLIDGHAIIHRAFHAVPEDLATSKGEVVNATFGFTSILIKALTDIKPDYLAVTFDRPAPTFRHENYAEYKAHRPTLPEIMRPQFHRVREVVEAFAIPIYEKDGFEADDVLGTLSVQATQQDVDTIIFTGDMDTLQLVNKHVHALVAKRGISEAIEYDEEAVFSRYGLPPNKLPDFKGLVGDKSDNIPGVPGIGEKTASKLLTEYGDLEGVLAHINELTPKEQRLLREMGDQARQSKYLATIVLDAPVKLDLEACRVGQFNRDKVIALFRELEFRTLVDKIPGGTNDAASVSNVEKRKPKPIEQQDEDLLLAPPVGVVSIMSPPAPPVPADLNLAIHHANSLHGGGSGTQNSNDHDLTEPVEELTQPSLFGTIEPTLEIVRKLRLPSVPQAAPLFLDQNEAFKTDTFIVDTEEALQVLVKSLRDKGRFSLDTESTSEDPWHAQLVGISLSMEPGEAYYIPVGHIKTIDGHQPGIQLPVAFVLEKLRPVFEDRATHKYMHNAKYDMLLLLLSNPSITVCGLAFDTMLGAYLTDPGRRGLGLKDQVFQRLGHVMTPISQLIGTGSKAISMAQVPIRQAADYAGADADMTLRLVEPIMEELRRNSLLELFHNIEMPLLPVLMQMEIFGVALDGDFLRNLNVQLAEQISFLENGIYDSVGHRFNINSTKQLGDILFGELKLPSGKKTKTGFSVSADVIESLRGQHPIVDYLLEYRQLSKLKSTY
ncbi:MAG TPA: DNA polymerase, partial [Ktedonobacteraceae bacterium]|nr:DNA polymerase [Ktedonobacteraceae bacterium]